MSKIQGASTEIKTSLVQECLSGKQENEKKEEIQLKYEYDITSQYRDDHPEAINFEVDEDVTPFRHEFEITNDGPSFTNKVETFSLIVPTILKDDDVTLEFQTFPEDLERNVTVDPNQCTRENHRYQCEIPKGLQKDSQIFAEVVMRFKADEKFLLNLKKSGLTTSPKHDEFEIVTHLEVTNTDSKSTGKSMFKKRETKVGLSTFVKQFWPYILGSLGAVIIFASIMYVSVKKGLHQKVRFTKNELEKRASRPSFAQKS